MKITLRELLDAIPVIDVLAQEKPKSAKLAYKLSRIVASARPEIELLQKSQGELLRTHGTCIDEPTGRWVIADENLPEFNEQWIPLLETEVEIWGNPIRIDDINGDLGGLTVDHYSRLGWLFTDEE